LQKQSIFYSKPEHFRRLWWRFKFNEKSISHGRSVNFLALNNAKDQLYYQYQISMAGADSKEQSRGFNFMKNQNSVDESFIF